MRDFEPVLATIRKRGEAMKRSHIKTVRRTLAVCTVFVAALAGFLLWPGKTARTAAPASMEKPPELYTESYSYTSYSTYVLQVSGSEVQWTVSAPEALLEELSRIEDNMYPSSFSRDYLYSETVVDEAEGDDQAVDISTSLSVPEYRFCLQSPDGQTTEYILTGRYLQKGTQTYLLDAAALERLYTALGIEKGGLLP